jgi:hypothetical protein
MTVNTGPSFSTLTEANFDAPLLFVSGNLVIFVPFLLEFGDDSFDGLFENRGKGYAVIRIAASRNGKPGIHDGASQDFYSSGRFELGGVDPQRLQVAIGAGFAS